VQTLADQGYTWVLDADIATYFDQIDHRILLGLLRQRVREVAVLHLIAQWLAVGAHTGMPDALDVALPDERSLLSQGARALQQLFEHATAQPLDPPFDDEFADFEDVLDPGWSRPPRGSRRPRRASSPLDALWTAFLVARPALAGVKRTLPQLQRINHQHALIAGGVAAGALAAYELALRWATPQRRGTTQGGALSPLLANIYLHPFDVALSSQGLHSVRFVDDFVVLCRSQQEAERALALVERQLAVLRLQLNRDKTAIRDYGDGLEFLGQTLLPRQRGPLLEQGLKGWHEADARLRAALDQARAGSRRARAKLRERLKKK
jgi:RNA-directed DNA polymerase